MIEAEVSDDYKVDQANHVDELQYDQYSMHPLCIKPDTNLGQIDSQRESKIRNKDAKQDIELIGNVLVLREAELADLLRVQRVVEFLTCVTSIRFVSLAHNEYAKGKDKQDAVEDSLAFEGLTLSIGLKLVSFCLILYRFKNFDLLDC